MSTHGEASTAVLFYTPRIMDIGAMESSSEYAYSGGELVLLPSTEEYKNRRKNDTVFLDACQTGRVDVVREYLSRFARQASYGFDDEDSTRRTSVANRAAQIAASSNQPEVMELLLRQCFYLDEFCIHDAAVDASSEGRVRMLEVLLLSQSEDCSSCIDVNDCRDMDNIEENYLCSYLFTGLARSRKTYKGALPIFHLTK